MPKFFMESSFFTYQGSAQGSQQASCSNFFVLLFRDYDGVLLSNTHRRRMVVGHCIFACSGPGQQICFTSIGLLDLAPFL